MFIAKKLGVYNVLDSTPYLQRSSKYVHVLPWTIWYEGQQVFEVNTTW